MRSTSPNFDDWRELPSIKIWEIAALMQGFEPRALEDVAVQDPNYPTRLHGVPPDMTWEIRRLISEVKSGLLVTAPAGVIAPNDDTEILNTSLVPWLRKNGFIELADELDTSSPTTGLTPPVATAPPTSPGSSIPATATVTTNGTAVIWTPARKLAAKTMLASEKARGAKAYAENTAKAFGVSTARLRAVLAIATKKSPVKNPRSNWHP